MHHPCIRTCTFDSKTAWRLRDIHKAIYRPGSNNIFLIFISAPLVNVSIRVWSVIEIATYVYTCSGSPMHTMLFISSAMHCKLCSDISVWIRASYFLFMFSHWQTQELNNIKKLPVLQPFIKYIIRKVYSWLCIHVAWVQLSYWYSKLKSCLFVHKKMI